MGLYIIWLKIVLPSLLLLYQLGYCLCVSTTTAFATLSLLFGLMMSSINPAPCQGPK